MNLTTLRGMLCRQEARVVRKVRRTSRSRRIGSEMSPEAMKPRLMPAVTISLDYSLDANGFFNSQARRDVMRYAANTLAASLNDTLAAITPNVPAGNTWTADFPDPSTGASRSIGNLTVPANTLIVYVGGGTLAKSAEAGEGSAGGFSVSGDSAWLDIVSARGKTGALATPATSFGPWGGSIEFDGSGGTNWYFGLSLANLGVNQTDFLSVAEHELGHVLGLGTAGSWDTLVSGGSFNGPTAESVNGGQPVPVNASGDHWASSVQSNGGAALMDPVLPNGTRSIATSLDIAALHDLGWQVTTLPAPTVQFNAPTYSVNETGGSLVVTVTRAGMPSAFSVNYATSDGTAHAGTDYAATSGVLSFANGELVKTFTIPILNDGLVESDETVNLALTTPTGGGVPGAPSTAVLTIIDPSNVPHAKPPGDFDGDGRSDLAVFHPSTATWTVQQSTAGLLTPAPKFGAAGLSDIPIAGDFDGVGHAQVAVFRPSTAQWFVLGSGGSHLLGTFGAANLFDIPVPGDYDGVGHTEMAVFRPSTAQWFVMGPSGGRLLGTFGAANLFDIPAPGDYDGTGHTEMAVFRPSTAQWFVKGPSGGRLLGTFGGANLFDIPVPGDYDATGHAQMAVFRPSTGQWFVANPGGGGHLAGILGATNYADVPVETSVGSLVKLGATRGSFAASGRPAASPSQPVVFIGPAVVPTAFKTRNRESVTADAWTRALEGSTAGS